MPLVFQRIMDWLLSILLAGISSFVATNLDDIIVLMVFFSQAHRQFNNRQIILGQYLGFTLILLASLPGLLGGMLIPRPWLGLLGLIPILIGIQQWREITQKDQSIQTVVAPNPSASQSPFIGNFFKKLLRFKICQVAAITVANGGDNISIYLPLFANSNWASFSIIIAIFYIMIGVWCLIAYGLTRRPLIAKILTRHGHYITPFVLMILGIFILLESKSYQLLPKLS